MHLDIDEDAWEKLHLDTGTDTQIKMYIDTDTQICNKYLRYVSGIFKLYFIVIMVLNILS